MSTASILIYIAVMAGVTYLIRVIPLVLFRREIKSVFMKSKVFLSVPFCTTSPTLF